MKTLILMRHAKSSWDHPKLSDKDRQLNKRGQKNASQAGQWLHRRDIMPDLVLCSSATRAQQTAELFSASSGYNGETLILDCLYRAEMDVFLDVLRSLPDHVERPMIIGHNPSLEMFFEYLTGMIESLPTAGIACLELPVDQWGELDSETGAKVLALWSPKKAEEPIAI